MLTCSDVPKIYFNQHYNSIENVIVLLRCHQDGFGADNELFDSRCSTMPKAQQQSEEVECSLSMGYGVTV